METKKQGWKPNNYWLKTSRNGEMVIITRVGRLSIPVDNSKSFCMSITYEDQAIFGIGLFWKVSEYPFLVFIMTFNSENKQQRNLNMYKKGNRALEQVLVAT